MTFLFTVMLACAPLPLLMSELVSVIEVIPISTLVTVSVTLIVLVLVPEA